ERTGLIGCREVAAAKAYGRRNWMPEATRTLVRFMPLPWVYARNRGSGNLPRHRPVQPARARSDWQFRLRRRLERRDVRAVAEFLVFVRDGGIDAIPQGKFPVDTATLLSFKQVGIQNAGIHNDACRVGAALPPMGIECVPPAIAVVIRLADHLDRNAKFLHAHSDIFFQLIPPAVGEVLGVVSRVFRDAHTKGNADLFLAGHAAMIPEVEACGKNQSARRAFERRSRRARGRSRGPRREW